MNFWIDAILMELPDQTEAFEASDIAQFFLDSPEFELLIGGPEESLSDADLLDLVYRNVLSREPDAAGEAFWLSVLDLPEFDRADLLVAFAISPEGQLDAPEVTALQEVSPSEWDFV